jgi:hypothetical protein
LAQHFLELPEMAELSFFWQGILYTILMWVGQDIFWYFMLELLLNYMVNSLSVLCWNLHKTKEGILCFLNGNIPVVLLLLLTVIS